jgi:hypothetical protein
MSRLTRSGVFAALLFSGLVTSALASPPPSKPFKTTVSLLEPAKLDGRTIKPGDYSLVFDNGKVTLTQDKKTVAEAPAEWVDIKEKDSVDGVVLDSGEIREFRFRGQKHRLVVH